MSYFTLPRLFLLHMETAFLARLFNRRGFELPDFVDDLIGGFFRRGGRKVDVDRHTCDKRGDCSHASQKIHNSNAHFRLLNV